MSNYQPVTADFDVNGNLNKMWGPNGKVAFDPSSVAITGGTIAGATIRGTNAVDVLGAEVGGAPIYGATGAGAITLGTLTVAAGRIVPGCLLRITGLCNLQTSYAGRSIQVSLNGTLLGASFPAALTGGLQFEHVVYVLPDLSGVVVSEQHLNNVTGPAAGAGAPFSALTNVNVPLTIDLTGAATFTVTMQPINNDVAQLQAWSVKMESPSAVPTGTLSPSTSLACFGDSLTQGTGSVGSAINTLSVNTTNGSSTVTTASTFAVVVGQIITGPGIPANSTVASFVANTSVTFTNDAATGATATAAVTATVFGGSWPQQVMYLMPGRPVLNAGVGGQTSTQILARILADKVRGKYWTPIFWMGRNDAGFTNTLANVRSAIANLPAGARYLVLNVTPGNGENSASGAGIAIAAYNASLATAIPATNLLDIFSVVTAGTGNGTIQASWMQDGTANNPHMNTLGYYQVAKAISAKLTANGW